MSNDTIPTTWVIQVRNVNGTLSPTDRATNPFSLWFVGGEVYAWVDDLQGALDRAVSLQAEYPTSRYHVIDQATLEATLEAAPAFEPPTAGLATEADTLAEAIRQHESDLATISDDMAEQAERRGWCSEYEGVLRHINSGLYRPLLTGRPNGPDTLPRRDRAAAAVRITQIQDPAQAQGWGIWHIDSDNTVGDWLVNLDGTPRAMFATFEAAVDRAREMRVAHSHQGHTYTVVPVPVTETPTDSNLIANHEAEVARLNSANEALRSQVNSVRNIRTQFLSDLGECLMELGIDEVDEAVLAFNASCASGWELPTREREYTVRANARITITLNVGVSTTVMARDDETAVEQVEFSDSDITDALRDEYGYDVARAWDGEYDLEDAEAEEA